LKSIYYTKKDNTGVIYLIKILLKIQPKPFFGQFSFIVRFVEEKSFVSKVINSKSAKILKLKG
jgi:hypothetical protein